MTAKIRYNFSIFSIMYFAGYIFLVILSILFSVYLWSRRKYYYLSWKMTSILGLPFLGVALSVRNQERILSYVCEKRKLLKTSTGIVWFGPIAVLYCSEPESMKKIFMSSSFVNKADYYKFVGKHFGVGLFSSNAPEYNHHRKLIEPSFHSQLLKNFMPIFNKEADILIDKLLQIVKDKSEVDIIPILQMCTLDIGCQTTMGKYMNFQKNQNAEIAKSYYNLLKLSSKRIFNPIYHSDFIFNLSHWGLVLKKSKKKLRSFISELITYKLSQSENENIDENLRTEPNNEYLKTHNIFIDRLIELFQNQQFSWKDVESESNVMVLAAYESSANTIGYTIACLAMFPEYQQKLYEELFNTFPDKDFVMTHDDLNKLTYLEMVINENMRLMAPIPLVGRTASEEFEFSDGIFLPKGCQVVLDIFNMQRDENYWGANAKKYYPDHFSKENLKNISPFAFVPFSKGVRTCIGSKYAMLSVRTILAKLIRRYRFETDFVYEDLQFIEDITIKFKKYPLFRIYERSK